LNHFTLPVAKLCPRLVGIQFLLQTKAAKLSMKMKAIQVNALICGSFRLAAARAALLKSVPDRRPERKERSIPRGMKRPDPG
jgi:hypothetical protein